MTQLTVCGFLRSVASSLTAVVILYLLYLGSGEYARAYVGKAECWWLPGANAFRFVIRNIPGRRNLFDVRYRTWLRRTLEPSDTISVGTFVDTDLTEGGRLLIPPGQDLPLICFRLEDGGPLVGLLVTDKMGNPIEATQQIDEGNVELMAEFSVRARTWLLFKHEINRLYAIRRYRDLKGTQRDIFREYLLPMQNGGERQMTSVSQYAEEITSTV